jgi:hypothetical protein
MHSSISTADEYASERVVAEILLLPKSSGAEYLTKPPSVSSEILVIPKPQICGSPLQVCGQRGSAPIMRVGSERRIHFVKDKDIFLHPFSQEAFIEVYKTTHAFGDDEDTSRLRRSIMTEYLSTDGRTGTRCERPPRRQAIGPASATRYVTSEWLRVMKTQDK